MNLLITGKIVKIVFFSYSLILFIHNLSKNIMNDIVHWRRYSLK